mmetsp:Transcript_11940/g.32120  ORF Transcript_11940/g.32120 Transcript_11940/m.32120 type:complete len:367 (-) Transcript_11940:2109-3209(-)
MLGRVARIRRSGSADLERPQCTALARARKSFVRAQPKKRCRGRRQNGRSGSSRHGERQNAAQRCGCVRARAGGKSEPGRRRRARAAHGRAVRAFVFANDANIQRARARGVLERVFGRDAAAQLCCACVDAGCARRSRREARRAAARSGNALGEHSGACGRAVCNGCSCVCMPRICAKTRGRTVRCRDGACCPRALVCVSVCCWRRFSIGAFTPHALSTVARGAFRRCGRRLWWHARCVSRDVCCWACAFALPSGYRHHVAGAGKLAAKLSATGYGGSRGCRTRWVATAEPRRRARCSASACGGRRAVRVNCSAEPAPYLAFRRRKACYGVIRRARIHIAVAFCGGAAARRGGSFTFGVCAAAVSHA